MTLWNPGHSTSQLLYLESLQSVSRYLVRCLSVAAVHTLLPPPPPLAPPRQSAAGHPCPPGDHWIPSSWPAHPERMVTGAVWRGRRRAMLVSDVAEKVQAAPTQPGLLHSSSLPSRLHEENPYLIWRGGHSSINISLYATANFRKEERKKNAETWISTFPYSILLAVLWLNNQIIVTA